MEYTFISNLLLKKRFEACTDKINDVINSQESIVCAAKLFNLNGHILCFLY